MFFSALGTAAGTVAAFATFGVAFFFRPVGSILFGHFGDRLGRKRTLIATLLLMGPTSRCGRRSRRRCATGGDEVLLAGGTLTVLFGFFYIGSVYLMSYAGSIPGAGVLGLSRPTVLIGGLIGALVFAGMCVLSAIWSDRYGRRRVILVGNALAAGPLAFTVMQPGNAVSFVVGIAVLMAVVGIPTGPPPRTCPRSSRPATATRAPVSATTSPGSSAAPCR